MEPFKEGGSFEPPLVLHSRFMMAKARHNTTTKSRDPKGVAPDEESCFSWPLEASIVEYKSATDWACFSMLEDYKQ